MADNGYIRLHRKILGWEWFRNPNTFHMFVYLLLKANYQQAKYEGKTLQRGQLLTTLPQLATDNQQTIQQARTSLSHLISTGEITVQSNNRYRIITVVKYDEYQVDNRQNNRQTTGKQQAEQQAEQQQYKNNKNNKKKEEINKTPSESTPPDGFDQFWSAYPRHVGKAEAKKQFDKLKPDVELLGKMLDAIERQKTSSQWQRDDGQYIPYPATWLNKKRWEDEVEVGSTPVIRPKVATDQKPDARDIHGYSQRDYSSEQAAAIARMMNDSWGDE